MIRGQLEQTLFAEGKVVAGVDEVGRGCLAGPVFAAAVILDLPLVLKLPSKERDLIRDSKTLSARQRQSLLPQAPMLCKAYAIGSASVYEIEHTGIVPATFSAMHRALELLSQPFYFLLIDGKFRLPGFPEEKQQAIIKGDHLCFSIALASIIAKEARDAHMREAAQRYPQYLFEKNVGYGTEHHLKAIRDFGICDLHRRNFRISAI